MTGKTSKRIWDVVSSPLTIKPNYVAKQTRNFDTLFKEIITVPSEQVLPPLYLKRLTQLTPQRNCMSESKFIELFIKTITTYIEKVWDPNKFNVVLHSGGWDSRIVSAILSSINRRKHLGNILFVCYGKECHILRKIMKIEGWKQQQYISIPQDDTYFRYNLNFKIAWRFLNGPSTFPINNPLWVIDAAHSLKRIPSYDKIVVWSAIYFNEVFMYLHGIKNTVDRFLKRYYYFWATNLISGFPFAFVEPVLNYNTLKAIIESKLALPKDIRLKIMYQIDPQLIRMSHKTNPTRLKIPEKYCIKIENDYDNSWYAKNIRPNIKKDFRIVHSPWWSAWSSASLVEYLIQKGITIKTS